MSPWEGSDPNDGWERLWGPGASLSCMENLAGPPGGFAHFARVQSGSSVRRRTKYSLAGIPAQSCAAGNGDMAVTL